MDTAVKQGGTNRWILGSLCGGSECTERGNGERGNFAHNLWATRANNDVFALHEVKKGPNKA